MLISAKGIKSPGYGQKTQKNAKLEEVHSAVICGKRKRIMPLKLNVGDIVELKKNHPCGGKTFEIMRVGMDFRIKCLQCGSQMRITRPKLEKSIIKTLEKPE